MCVCECVCELNDIYVLSIYVFMLQEFNVQKIELNNQANMILINKNILLMILSHLFVGG